MYQTAGCWPAVRCHSQVYLEYQSFLPHNLLHNALRSELRMQARSHIWSRASLSCNNALSRCCIYKAAKSLSICSSSTSGAAEVAGLSQSQQGLQRAAPALNFSVRETTEDDWWLVSEVHCQSFYPRAGCLMGVLLRFDRVQSIQTGFMRGQEEGCGRFACFIASLDDMETVAEGLVRASTIKIPSFLKAFVSAPLKAGFNRRPEEFGVIGTVIVDSLGEHVPRRKRKGHEQQRKGIAYVSNLAVDKAFRRQGIGRRLLDHAGKVAKEWGCHAIVLHCDPRNAGAREMYVRAGYRHVADEPLILQFVEGRPGNRLELMIKTLKN